MRQLKKTDQFSRFGLNLCPLFKFPGIIFLLTVLIILFPKCAPVFSDLQSAKLVGPGHIEITPSFSSVSFFSEGESEHIQNHYGIQAGLGVFSKMDFRLRYERISLDTDSDESYEVNVLGFGPKFSLLKDWAAIYIPVGFAFGEDIEISDTWQVHPTLLLTFPINKYIEFNPSVKALIPFKSEQDTLVAFNLGIALSTNLEKWAIRPEIGFLYNPWESGHNTHLSIGFTYFTK